MLIMMTQNDVIKSGKMVSLPVNFMPLLGSTVYCCFAAIIHNGNLTQLNVLSYSAICALTGISKNTIKTAIADLIKLNFIKKQATGGHGTTYIVNWDSIN